MEVVSGRVGNQYRYCQKCAVEKNEMNYQEEMIKGLQRDNLALRREVKSANNRVLTMTALTLVTWVIATIMVSQSAEASEGRNWCSEWADGYVVGFCWSRTDCDYIPPAICPAPKEGEHDGYIVGLKDGLADGRVEL